MPAAVVCFRCSGMKFVCVFNVLIVRVESLLSVSAISI